jgi:hypothetical protein
MRGAMRRRRRWWQEQGADQASDAVRAFLVERVDAAGLCARAPWVELCDHASAHEQGAAAFVEQAWQRTLAKLGEEPPDSVMGRLLPLVRACAGRPRLRALMPYTSLDRLCLSRTTGYPYASACPPVSPTGANRFRIHASTARAVSPEPQ